MKKLSLNIEINLEPIVKAIEGSKTLDDNELLFAQLSAIEFDKEQINLLQESFDKVYKEIKQVINDKAKALYGPKWSAIQGKNYKITRSLTGSVYQIIDLDKIPEDLLKVEMTVESKLVEDYIKSNSKLPEGLGYNPNRNESLRIKVNPNDDKT